MPDDDIAIKLAKIEGTLGVMKSWGIGLASIIAAMAFGTLIFAANSFYGVADLRADVHQIQEIQAAQRDGQFQATEAKLNELLQAHGLLKRPDLKEVPKK